MASILKAARRSAMESFRVGRQWQPSLMFALELVGAWLVIRGISMEADGLAEIGLCVVAVSTVGVWITPDLPDIPPPNALPK